VLVIGYGNPGRMDDGLGPALGARIEGLGLPGVAVTCGYQLDVEDAAEMAGTDLTVFVDAARTGPEPFGLSRVQPREETSFSSHSLGPGALLHLARSCFDCRVRGWLLGIRGYEFDGFREELSPGAERNLDCAEKFLTDILCDGVPDFERARAAVPRRAPAS
jgi:hydrogenase maturation protease